MTLTLTDIKKHLVLVETHIFNSYFHIGDIRGHSFHPMEERKKIFNRSHHSITNH